DRRLGAAHGLPAALSGLLSPRGVPAPVPEEHGSGPTACRRASGEGGGRTMSKDRNLNQIIRKDARGCFVESLNDVFSIGKAHLAFVAYDLHSPAGQRQTDNIHIYLDIAELLELCRKAESGELRQAVQAQK